ncbi:Inner membrane protein YcfT [Pseudovibrio axinellae]|uniref:Inner membrane protein YcfT n=1 Tax=Pseudovibrio axinellae TaxID=989403 RepID=A0A165Z343_9HYPH|nr:acyltransferase family protein [Pseudovibrio axinellae]KZL19469.1 Inner membrane protein YcfT [Pseudovibrio axinellae]SEQ28021.1 Uncharacterized membrane protein YcfT [Pseudovibrio axinellae]
MVAHQTSDRVDWVDYAKGFCIFLVVMMHSTLGVGEAIGETGFMGAVVAFAKPFRMPDFFMISGLFLALTIDRDWRLYLDRKLVHFFYFYILWLTIQFTVKAPSFAAQAGWDGALSDYLLAFVQPFGTLWFIYVLPVFFVISKVLHALKLPWQATLLVAAVLQISQVHTGSVLIDETASRFVFFFAGYVFAQKLFVIADWVRDNTVKGMMFLALWCAVNGLFVGYGYADLPFASLALGSVGALAVIVASALLSKVKALSLLRYMGQNSIVIYLSFFFPMVVTRMFLLAFGNAQYAGLMSLIITCTATVAPIILFGMINRWGYGQFLFSRPAWAYVADKPIAKTGVISTA